ncbi:hypothetical protein [Prochlorothrix hollandica]|uniref:Uncharacterized protein n=1 Tax=Prochlorothrix hollandica PCC 9006 = CALU 1027 TaxID=317619 RepID=A0A0M2PV77_PROHO|nr:hypothetical protein [Prochlorothrix hollandica]KKJ00020.1 hypothetical protein PROH_09605 [Prochlorothrix hollandica PCC 9006 = CALU 1027]
MTFTELLTAAKELSLPDQIRLASELLQSIDTHWLPSNPFQLPSPEPKSLLAFAATLSPLDEDWPDCDQGLLPLEDDIDL